MIRPNGIHHSSLQTDFFKKTEVDNSPPGAYTSLLDVPPVKGGGAHHSQIIFECVIYLVVHDMGYRGTSLIRDPPLSGPYGRTLPRVLWWSWGGGAASHERGTPVGDLLVYLTLAVAFQVQVFSISLNVSLGNWPSIHCCLCDQRFHFCFEKFHSRLLSRWAALLKGCATAKGVAATAPKHQRISQHTRGFPRRALRGGISKVNS